MPTSPALDLRRIAPPQRHAALFAAFDDLAVGASLTLANDHDPRPLYHQMKTLRPDSFEWTYVEAGPEEWRVRIAKTRERERSEGACCGHCGG